jgi:predicted phage replisome organizer
MSKYLWFKLDANILDDEKIKLIRRMENGDTYFVLWIGLLSYAMAHESSVINITAGLPATADDIAAIFSIQPDIAKKGLEIFKQFKMIYYDDSGAIVITNFDNHQSLDELENKRREKAEKSRKYREKNKSVPERTTQNRYEIGTKKTTYQNVPERGALDQDQEIDQEKENTDLAPQDAALESPPHPLPAKSRKASEEKQDSVPAETFIAVEEAWDKAYTAECGVPFLRNYGRDRKMLAPLIIALGADEVQRRMQMYFTLPAQYFAREIKTFREKINDIPAKVRKSGFTGVRPKPLDLGSAVLGGEP